MEENKTVIDTRTFQEIWKSLSPIEQGHLRYQLIRETTYTRQAINAWTNGAVPINKMARTAVAKVVNRVLGLNTTQALLFPSAR